MRLLAFALCGLLMAASKLRAVWLLERPPSPPS